MNLTDHDLAVLHQLVGWEHEDPQSIDKNRREYLLDLAARLLTELSRSLSYASKAKDSKGTPLGIHPSRSTERRLDVQRDAMSDFDRDKIGHEDNDGTLGLRDRRG